MIVLFAATHCSAQVESSIFAGYLCSGAKRYSTFTTIHGESLKNKHAELFLVYSRYRA
jgi:hypothetical protein